MTNKPLDLQNYRKLESFELFARQVVEGFITGLHKSPYHGFSVEFSEHRVYNPGESTKNIDWKLYGRTDRLYTKRYEEETNLRCRLVLDTSGSMFFPKEGQENLESPNKFLFSYIASLALMNLLRKQRDAVGLSTFGDYKVQTPARSTFQHHRTLSIELHRILESFDKGSASKGNSMAQSLHEMAEQIHRRSFIVMFSDLFEMQENEQEVMDALQHLKYNKHELTIFWTTDHRYELDFDYEDRPYRFVDMESGESLKLNPGQVKEKYLDEMKAFEERLKLKCTQYKINLVKADVSQGYYPVLQSYLVQRKKMF